MTSHGVTSVEEQRWSRATDLHDYGTLEIEYEEFAPASGDANRAYPRTMTNRPGPAGRDKSRTHVNFPGPQTRTQVRSAVSDDVRRSNSRTGVCS